MLSGSVGPAAPFSLQLSYVLFMPSVECPALPGHWWQCQTEDNKCGCQLALQDLAADSVWWPQSGSREMISALPAGLWGDPQTSIALPLGSWGSRFALRTWPCPSQLLALFIDWKLMYNLIFHLLISPTVAASCQRGDGGINGNLVWAGEGPGRGRPLIDRSPASSWQQDSSRSMRKAMSLWPYWVHSQLTTLPCLYMGGCRSVQSLRG